MSLVKTDADALPQIESLMRLITYERSEHIGDLRKLITANGALARTFADPLGPPSRTGTSFAMFAVTQAGLSDTAFAKNEWEDLRSYLNLKLAKEIGALPGSPILNEYNVPIWACGLIAGLATLKSPMDALPNLTLAIESIANEMRSSSGGLRRVLSSAEPVPSAYLTFWASCALILTLKNVALSHVEEEALRSTLREALRWAEQRISQLIADHHAGIPSRFDVVECICAACIAARLNHSPFVYPRPRDEISQLAVYAASIALDNYFEGGSFKLSRPVFADEHHNAVLCPTSEAMFFILSSFSARDQDQLFDEGRWRKLEETFQWCRRNRRDVGYPPDFDAS